MAKPTITAARLEQWKDGKATGTEVYMLRLKAGEEIGICVDMHGVYYYSPSARLLTNNEPTDARDNFDLFIKHEDILAIAKR